MEVVTNPLYGFDGPQMTGHRMGVGKLDKCLSLFWEHLVVIFFLPPLLGDRVKQTIWDHKVRKGVRRRLLDLPVK